MKKSLKAVANMIPELWTKYKFHVGIICITIFLYFANNSRNRTAERFKNGFEVDTILAQVIEFRHHKYGYRYKMRYEINGVTHTSLMDRCDTNFPIGVRIPIVFLKDNVETIRPMLCNKNVKTQFRVDTITQLNLALKTEEVWMLYVLNSGQIAFRDTLFSFGSALSIRNYDDNLSLLSEQLLSSVGPITQK